MEGVEGASKLPSQDEPATDTTGGEEEVHTTSDMPKKFNVLRTDAGGVNPPQRGTPTFRISAHHGMRPASVVRDLEAENVGRGQQKVTDGSESALGNSKPGDVSSKEFAPKGPVGRGNPTFRISAHHGMQPASAGKDFTTESADKQEDN